MIRLHLRATEWLAGYAWNTGLLMFKMRPKHHAMFHLMLDTKAFRINPRVFSCFGEEAFLGRIKYIARQCHGKTMCVRVLQRYIIAVASFFHAHAC